jgi:hypothetical protein
MTEWMNEQTMNEKKNEHMYLCMNEWMYVCKYVCM